MLRDTTGHEFDDLSNEEQLESALRRSAVEPIIIYKHSDICGLSAIAQREVRKYASEARGPIYKVVVQKARAVSEAIERILGIRHESPQAIVVRNRHAIYDASHRGVTALALAEAVRRESGFNG